jgi:hypothetical protein
MNTSYTEIQRFRQWWLVLPMMGFTGWMFTGLIQQLMGGAEFGNNPMPNDGAIIFMLCWTAFLYFFFIGLHLRTEADAKGLRVRLNGISSERFTWENIEKMEFITYRFVGYGLRLATRYGTVYNVSGNKGLLVTLKDGGRFLIGTAQPEKFESYLRILGKLQEPPQRRTEDHSNT